MTIAIDHIGVLARDVAASGRFLAEILGIAPGHVDGPGGEMYRLPVGETGSLLYFPGDEITGMHIAFRVDGSSFDGVVQRLRARGVVFGNDPEAITNMEITDFLGGYGRVFFQDPNGHLFEVFA